MAEQSYKQQVSLLLSVLPEVAKESCFALHGGTAINLFVREMPRLSVDIDLTYLPLEDRLSTLIKINTALDEIKSRIIRIIPDVRITHQHSVCKLLISQRGMQIKVEVNTIMRGSLPTPSKRLLCVKAQNDFDAFCSINVLPLGQLYGGKICAALDRQHPRDLFDVKYLLKAEGLNDEVKTGFLLCLLSSDRPISEVLNPNLIDQRQTLANHFDGMATEPFTYDDFEATRAQLIGSIRASLTAADKQFLLSFKNLKPDWGIHNFEMFPAIQWKLQNLQKLKDRNSAKHLELLQRLERLIASYES